MTKKRTAPKAETAEGLPEGFRVEAYGEAGKFAYFDHAGRMFKGYDSEEDATEAANSHTHLENDPTLDPPADE